MNQDELKALVGKAALEFVPNNTIIGVGTGSTVNKFIDALAKSNKTILGAVSSSDASTKKLIDIGIKVLDATQVNELSVYVDGADEIDSKGNMLKGGGAALTREKIVADLAHQFICIVDSSKLVTTLGGFPLPIEIIPSSMRKIMQRCANLNASAQLRLLNGKPLVTDNGQHILDVSGLSISDPLAFEKEVNNWPGVVTVGVFALNKANLALVGTAESGVKTIKY